MFQNPSIIQGRTILCNMKNSFPAINTTTWDVDGKFNRMVPETQIKINNRVSVSVYSISGKVFTVSHVFKHLQDSKQCHSLCLPNCFNIFSSRSKKLFISSENNLL